MRKGFLLMVLSLVVSTTIALGQDDYQRKLVTVPKVDPAAITIDGNMDEPAWATGGKADMITSAGFEIFTNKYYRESLTEPDYDEMYARMLWAKDTLYVFMHIDEFVDDSTDLFWTGEKWQGDQLFISLSNRLGVDMTGWYDGNVYAAPDGPYHFLVLGDRVTLNNEEETYLPDEYQAFPDDTTRVYDAATIARWATFIDTLTGVWNVEMAIYQPNASADARIGFNIGGSTGSAYSQDVYGDAYAYFTWQPSVVDSPYAQPQAPIESDPGFYNLANADCWALLHLEPGMDDYQRKLVTVPKVDPAAITIDGNMDEPAWATGGKADMITSAGFEIFTNKYYRESLTEPDYDEMYARMLWAKDTLYVFMHIDEFVDDSTDLFWTGEKWQGDQLFISLSNRLGVDMTGWYDGNVYAAPDGPYHFLVLGDRVTLNNEEETYLPDEYQAFPDDTTRVYDAATIARWATFIDTLTGVWNVEMAIYQPNASADARIGFNIGGSTGSAYSQDVYGDAYAYFTWQPSVVDSPYAQPQAPIESDPGFYNLANADCWALLEFGPEGTSGVDNPDAEARMPNSFVLNQNYPNPFNPSTRVSFDVPRAAKVTLTAYNLLGQKVATLVNERLSAGRHEMTWNAQNLPSGMYIMYMQADGSFISSRKMMLLK